MVGDTVGRPSIVLDGANGTILFAAQGDIGEANTPLIYSASNDTVFMAMTEGSMYVTGASGILADSIAARSKAVLRAASGDIQRTQTGTITAGWVELFAEQGGIGMKGHRVIVSTTRVSALAYGNIFLEIQGRYVLSDYIKSLAGTVDVIWPSNTFDQLLAGLSQTDRILGGMASGGSFPPGQTGSGLLLSSAGALNLGGQDDGGPDEGGSDGRGSDGGGQDGRGLVFGVSGQDGDQDQGEDEDKGQKEDQDDDQDDGQDDGKGDGKGDEQGAAGGQSGSPLFPRI